MERTCGRCPVETTSMSSKKTFDCAVCPNKTDKACSKCKIVYFCSPACQALIWPVHSWLCGKDPTVFSVAPLSASERQATDAKKTKIYKDRVSLQMNIQQTLLERVHDLELFKKEGTWNEFLDSITKGSARPLEEPYLSASAILARVYRTDHLAGERPSGTRSEMMWQSISGGICDLITSRPAYENFPPENPKSDPVREETMATLADRVVKVGYVGLEARPSIHAALITSFLVNVEAAFGRNAPPGSLHKFFLIKS
ncbi:hypothetical protein JCM10212_006338 [Sporobolomyces blumeae]